MGENMVLKHSVVLEPGITRRDALKVGALATASAIFGKYLVLSEARADQKSGNGNGNGQTYKTVKLSKVQEWDKAAQKYRVDCGGKEYCLDGNGYSASVSIQSDQLVVAAILYIYSADDKRKESKLILNVRENGTHKKIIVGLDKVIDLYPDLKCARLVIEIDRDEKGPFSQIWMVPVENPKASVKCGVPIVGVGHGGGEVWSTEIHKVARS